MADPAQQLARDGFVVLRQAFDAAELTGEVGRALADATRGFSAQVGGAALGGRYVPMMCARTPLSLALLDRFAREAEALLGAPVLPVRAKGVLYFAGTAWHRDSTEPALTSLGFAAYLEPLQADTGALRVRPGSHRLGEAGHDGAPEVALETTPGDVIVFDEHLLHASSGGRDRRQWRVDFVADAGDAAAEARLRAYFAGIYRPDWDGGYDVERYPSYGPAWLASGRPCVARLGALGVYQLCAAEEAFARGRR